MTTADFTPVLLDLFQRVHPASILCIGYGADEAIKRYQETVPDCRVDTVAADNPAGNLDSRGRWDLVFLGGVIEFMDKPAAEELIAKLRDIHARFLVIAVPMGDLWSGHTSVWDTRDLVRLGLVRTARLHRNGSWIELHTFDVNTYKSTPDWLNSRFWAHPERYGKDWW